MSGAEPLYWLRTTRKEAWDLYLRGWDDATVYELRREVDAERPPGGYADLEFIVPHTGRTELLRRSGKFMKEHALLVSFRGDERTTAMLEELRATAPCALRRLLDGPQE